MQQLYYPLNTESDNKDILSIKTLHVADASKISDFIKEIKEKDRNLKDILEAFEVSRRNVM